MSRDRVGLSARMWDAASEPPHTFTRYLLGDHRRDPAMSVSSWMPSMSAMVELNTTFTTATPVLATMLVTYRGNRAASTALPMSWPTLRRYALLSKVMNSTSLALYAAPATKSTSRIVTVSVTGSPPSTGEMAVLLSSTLVAGVACVRDAQAKAASRAALMVRPMPGTFPRCGI